MTEEKKEQIVERVHQGVQLLDKQVPDWHRKIDSPEVLDMASLTKCILGLVFGSFGRGTLALGINGIEAMNYGFDLDSSLDGAISCSSYYDELTKEWRRQLNKRS